MAVISDKRGYLFVQTPRTGCTAIAEGVLIPKLDGEHFPPSDIYNDEGQLLVQQKHCSLQALVAHELIAPSRAQSLFKFTTVRNPFDSVASLYEKMRSKYAPMLDDPDAWVHKDPNYAAGIRFAVEHSFDEWVEHRFGRTPLRRMASRVRSAASTGTDPMYVGMDYVMRFEHLQADFQHVLDRLGVDEPIEIPRINTTEDRAGEYASYYTPGSRRTIEREYRDRIERFDYEFGS